MSVASDCASRPTFWNSVSSEVLCTLLFIAVILFVAKWIRIGMQKTRELESRALAITNGKKEQ